MIRKGIKMYLKPGFVNEYRRRHQAIPIDLVAHLKSCGITDYSIFFDKETNVLFASQKNSDNYSEYNLRNNEVMQDWWRSMSDIMEVNSDFSPKSDELSELFVLN